MEGLFGTAYFTELTATVSAAGDKTSLQVRPSRSQQKGNASRSPAMMSVRPQDQTLADSVAKRCSEAR